MSQLDSQYDGLAWGSHLPVLIAAVASSVGPVLELGVGHFSTPALHSLCGSLQKKLVSVESSREWFDIFNNRYSDSMHSFILSEYSSAHPVLGGHWGAVFIDNSPGGERRKEDFLKFITKSDFVVVHDYELDNEDAIGPMLGSLEYFVYNRYKPPTLIASAFRKIPASIK